MKCQVCGADTSPGSAFCSKCGAKLQGSNTTEDSPRTDQASSDKYSAAGASAAGASGRVRDVPEETLWEGTYSPKAMIGIAVLFAVLTVVLLIAAFLTAATVVLSGGMLVAIAILWLVAAVRLATHRLGRSYRLTNQMFYHRQGVINRKTDRIELIEIHDVSWEQGLFERAVGVGTITISSADRTDPKLPVPGIENVESVASQIDKARRAEQVRRGRRIDFSNVDHQT